MFKIKDLEINNKVVLAPMAGITSSGYRQFMQKFGCGVFVSEMISDMGIIYDNQETKTYLDFPKMPYTGIQLFGYDSKCIQKAAKLALERNENIDFIDVNMGCPVLKVTKTGAGSSLLKNPKMCGEIIRKLKEITNKPITAKIRLGWDEKSLNFKEVINVLQEAGVDAIAIHARTKSELYSGLPHFDLLKDLRKQMSVPLIISGNIYTLDDAINAINITGADAVMVARGGVGNPYLITQIEHYYKTGERLNSPSIKEQINYCLSLADYLIKEKGEQTAMRIYRGIASKFFFGFPNAKYYKAKLSQDLITKQNLIDILESLKQELNI